MSVESHIQTGRVCILILSLILALTISALAVEEEGGLIYTVSNETATVTGCTDSGITELIVPAELGGRTVVGVGGFAGKTELRMVELPEGVTMIKDSAFYNCPLLQEVKLPMTLQDLGDQAFGACKMLTQIHLPAKVNQANSRYLGAPFHGSGLVQISFEPGTQRIGNKMFNGCADLEEIIIPDTVTEIGDSTFANCTLLRQVILPHDLQVLGAFAFQGCVSLKDISLPASIIASGVGGKPFLGSGLMNITMEDGTKEIIENLFYGCNELEEITLPSSVTKINGDAFRSCQKLRRVVLPEGLKQIHLYAFYDCKALAEIKLPSTLELIEQNAFQYCESLTSVRIPKGLTYAGGALRPLGGAFTQSGVTHIEFEEGTERIAPYVFYDCDKLISVTIPASVKMIGEEAFDMCNSLQSVNIMGSDVEIGSRAFRSYSVTSIYFHGTPPKLMSSTCFPDREDFALYYIDETLGWTTPLWNGYRTRPFDKGLLLSEPVYNNGTEYHHTVFDYETGLPVQGARVTTDRNGSQTTDAQGMVVLSTDILTLTVEAEGYEMVNEYYQMPQTGEPALLGGDPDAKKHSQTTGMLPKGKYHLHKITLICEGEHDIRNQTWMVNQQQNKTFDITCVPVSDYQDKIASYQLMQGSKVIGSSNTGKFSGLTAAQFEVGRMVEVKLFNKSGMEIGGMRTNLKIVNVGLPAGFSFNLGQEGSDITIPDDVPVFGGQTISLHLPEFPASVNFGDQTIRYALGGTLKGWNNPPASNDPDPAEENWKQLKAEIDDAIHHTNGKTAKTAAQNFRDMMRNGQPPKKLKWAKDLGVSINVGGYAECDWGGTTLEGKIYVVASGEANFNSQVAVGAVPVVLEGTLSGEVGAGLKVTWVEKTIVPAGTLDMGLGLELYAAPGIQDVASVGVYGAGSTALALQLQWKDSGVKNWSISGEFGIKGKLLIWEQKIKLLEGEYVIYPRSKSTGLSLAAAHDAITDTAGYEIMPRDYLAERSPWMGGGGPRLFGLEPGGIETLQESAYPGAEPKLISAGDTTMMVFLDDDETGPSADRTRLMYTLCDGAGWSEPKPVDPENGTADFAPALCADGTEIYLLWQSAKGALSEEMTPEEMGAALELSLARYDGTNDSFTEIEVLTDNDRYEAMPRVSAAGGTVTACWVENSSGDLFGVTGTNTIRRAVKENDTWTVSTVTELPAETVAGLELGALDSQAAVAWIADGDQDLYTSDDQRAWVWTAPGGARLLAGTPAHSLYFAPAAGEPALLWFDGANLQSVTAADGTPAPLLEEGTLEGIPDEVLVSADGEKRAILCTRGGGEEANSNLYAILYDNTSGTWGKTVALTAQDRYLECPSAVYAGQDLILAFQQNQVDAELNKITSLCWMAAAERAELSLTEAFCDDTTLTPGGQAAIRVGVRNGGTVPSGGRDVLELTGVTAGGPVTIPAIPSGGSLLLEVPVTLPDTLEGAQCKAALNGQTMAVPLGLADLALKAEQYIMGEKNIVIATVTNRGAAAADGSVELSVPGDETARFQSMPFRALASGQSTQVSFTADRGVLGGEDTMDLMVRVSTPAKQQTTSNDEAMVTLRGGYGELRWAGLETAGGHLTGQLKNAGPDPVAGTMVLAAYEGGRLVETKTEQVTLGAGAGCEIDWQVAGASRFRTFFLSGDTLVPLLAAGQCTE